MNKQGAARATIKLGETRKVVAPPVHLEIVVPDDATELFEADPVLTSARVGHRDGVVLKDNRNVGTPSRGVGIGLWDRAFDGSHKVRTDAEHGGDFIDRDVRRFYFRVHSRWASRHHGRRITASWWTTFPGGKTLDKKDTIHLYEFVPHSGVFVSRALMLVGDYWDRHLIDVASPDAQGERTTFPLAVEGGAW